jgi:hypothetical protein
MCVHKKHYPLELPVTLHITDETDARDWKVVSKRGRNASISSSMKRYRQKAIEREGSACLPISRLVTLFHITESLLRQMTRRATSRIETLKK